MGLCPDQLPGWSGFSLCSIPASGHSAWAVRASGLSRAGRRGQAAKSPQPHPALLLPGLRSLARPLLGPTQPGQSGAEGGQRDSRGRGPSCPGKATWPGLAETGPRLSGREKESSWVFFIFNMCFSQRRVQLSSGWKLCIASLNVSHDSCIPAIKLSQILAFMC